MDAQPGPFSESPRVPSAFGGGTLECQGRLQKQRGLLAFYLQNV